MGSAGWLQVGFLAECFCHSQRQSTPPQLTTAQRAANLPLKTLIITREKFIETRRSYKIINLACHLGFSLARIQPDVLQSLHAQGTAMLFAQLGVFPPSLGIFALKLCILPLLWRFSITAESFLENRRHSLSISLLEN